MQEYCTLKKTWSLQHHRAARSPCQPRRCPRGEDVLAEKTEAEEAVVAAEGLFEEGAGLNKEEGEETEEKAEE